MYPLYIYRFSNRQCVFWAQVYEYVIKLKLNIGYRQIINIDEYTFVAFPVYTDAAPGILLTCAPMLADFHVSTKLSPFPIPQ
jgi:hypothetical protein